MTVGEWLTMPLREFTTLQRGHDLPDHERHPGPIPILGSFGVTGWHDVARAPGPGVTVGRSGASFGVVTYSAGEYWPLNTALYVTDFHGNDVRFAYYFLKQFDFTSYNSGSAQPSLNRNFVHPVPVHVPPVPEQRAIGRLLGALDDKIELNRRMNETIEGLIRALYRLRTKTAGVQLGDVCRIVVDRVEAGAIGGRPYIAMDDLRVKGLVAESYASAEGIASQKTLFEANDILVGKLRPNFRKAGRVDRSGVCSTEILALRPLPSQTLTVVGAVGQDEFFDRLVRHADGTRMPRVRPDDVLSSPVRLGSGDRDESMGVALLDLAAGNAAESGTLAQLRDTLLPELVSGRMHVNEVGTGLGAAI